MIEGMTDVMIDVTVVAVETAGETVAKEEIVETRGQGQIQGTGDKEIVDMMIAVDQDPVPRMLNTETYPQTLVTEKDARGTETDAKDPEIGKMPEDLPLRESYPSTLVIYTKVLSRKYKTLDSLCL